MEGEYCEITKIPMSPFWQMLPSVACVLECTCGPEIVLSICFLFPFFIKRLFGLECCGFFYPHRRCIFIPWYGKNMGEGGLKWYKWEIIRCLQFIPFGNAVGRSESATCKNRVQVLSPCSSLGRGWYHTVPLAVRGASRAARNQTVKTISMRKFSRREEVELFRASHRKTWPDMRSSK